MERRSPLHPNLSKSAIALTSQLVQKRVKRSYPVGNRPYII
ncbi:hypothetical protein QUA54_00475 [Microcoleus sp. MOSTC5]